MADQPDSLILSQEAFPRGHGRPAAAIQDGLNQQSVRFPAEVPRKQGRPQPPLQRHTVTGTAVLRKQIQQLPLSLIGRYFRMAVLCQQQHRERQQAIECTVDQGAGLIPE